MRRPKLPSEQHPDYPRRAEGENHDVWLVRFHAFHFAHPEFKNEGEYEFRCPMCGNEVDDDHMWCVECSAHSGEWVLVDEDGEEIAS